ncbi:MAG: amidohydrolase family protein [Bacteroidota bacterium]
MRQRLTLLSLIFSALVFGQKTYLHCGQVLDVKSGKMLKAQTLVITGNTISDVQSGYIAPTESQDQAIDLKNMTVLPGFIDMHVHLEGESNPQSYIQRFTLNEADVAFLSTLYAKKTLMAGFTTVRDLGGSGVNIALRKAIDRGTVVGPRVFTAGKAIASTGGHADPTNGMRNDLKGDPGPKEGVVNSPRDGVKAVRQRYKDGADVIKITATGGVLSVAKSGQNPQFTIEEIKAITETAKDYNMLTAAHAHGDEGMQRAVIGGIKTIEHGTLMSEKTMDLMVQYDAYLVPTITAGKQVTEKAKIPGYFPKVVAQKASEIGPKVQNTFGKAYKKGVPIAFGTDAGVFPHGENAREFKYMVEAGMPALEVIQSATITNANLLGMEKDLGQLKKGFLADIVAVEGNPLEEINILESIGFVMKDGKVYQKPN